MKRGFYWMAGITTWSELIRVLEKETEKAVAYAGDQIKKILHDNVQNLWYRDRGEQYQYSRTYEVINSITLDTMKQGKGGYSAVIYFDENKINPYESDSGFFNKHMSLDGSTNWGGQSIASLLISWMESGQNSPIYSYYGAGFVEATYDVAKDDAVFLIEESLQKAGFKTVIVR